jgi:hypothetical protein
MKLSNLVGNSTYYIVQDSSTELFIPLFSALLLSVHRWSCRLLVFSPARNQSKPKHGKCFLLHQFTYLRQLLKVMASIIDTYFMPKNLCDMLKFALHDFWNNC